MAFKYEGRIEECHHRNVHTTLALTHPRSAYVEIVKSTYFDNACLYPDEVNPTHKQLGSPICIFYTWEILQG